MRSTIEEEIQMYSDLPMAVRQELPKFLLPAEYYMLERIMENNKTPFKNDMLRRDKLFETAKKWSGDNISRYGRIEEYLLYRLNGGCIEMFDMFLSFNPRIQRLLIAAFQPAEKYFEISLKKTAFEKEMGRCMPCPEIIDEFFRIRNILGFDTKALEYAKKRLVYK